MKQEYLTCEKCKHTILSDELDHDGVIQVDLGDVLRYESKFDRAYLCAGCRESLAAVVREWLGRDAVGEIKFIEAHKP